MLEEQEFSRKDQEQEQGWSKGAEADNCDEPVYNLLLVPLLKVGC